jgi:NAD kinase
MVIAVFGNTLRQSTISEIKHIVEFLKQRGIVVVLSSELRTEVFARELPSVDDYVAHSGETIDFAISVGGDGTFLTTASLVGHLDIPILGINSIKSLKTFFFHELDRKTLRIWHLRYNGFPQFPRSKFHVDRFFAFR